MSWYQATLNLDGIRSKLRTEAAPFVFFDSRLLSELHTALWAHGYIEVERASTEKRIESRGMAILRDPHVIAIEQRLDLDMKSPNGPPPFVMRAPFKKLKLAVVAK